MNNIIKRVWNQNRMVNIEDLCGMAFQAESGGHTFEISGADDTGAAVALSGTVTGVFRRPDNADIALTGSASDGVVSVTLTNDCYAVPGRFGLTIFVTSGGQKTAVYAAVGTVAATNGGAVAGDTPQDVVDLINAIEAAVATIPADYTDLMAAIAPMYSNSALYAVGSYAWYDGDLYRCTTPITTAETWTAAHWTAAVIGKDVTAIGYAGEVNASLLSAELQNDTSAKSVLLSGILNGSNVWASLATGQHNLFPVNPGDSVRIKANSSTGTVYAVLRSYQLPVASAAPDFSQQSGFTTRLTLTKNTDTTFTVPSDGHYLYVTYGNSGTVNFPAILTVNGRNVLVGVRKQIDDISVDIPNMLKTVGVIESGDIDDYTSIGVWRIKYDISNISNLPYSENKRADLFVVPSVGGGPPHQIIFTAEDGRYYQRFYVDGAWTAWADNITAIMPTAYFTAGTNADTVLSPGIYLMTRQGNYTNFPFDNSTDRGYMIVINPVASTSHTLQIAVDGVNGNTYQRIYFDSTWTAWALTNGNHIIGTNPGYKAVDHGGFFDRDNHRNYQNSPKAFLDAAHKGIRYHNLDICFTSDGVPVVHHDNTFTDINNVSVTISNTTLSNLANHRDGDSNYNYQIMTLAECAAFIKTIGGVIDMVDVSVTDPTNVALLGDYYAAHNIKPTWTNFNVTSDTTVFINANHDKYGVYLVCDTDADIDTMIAYVNSHNTYGTKFMFNMHSSGSGMTNADAKIKDIVDAGVSSIYCYLYKAAYIDTIGIPAWADAVLSEVDNVPYAQYLKNAII